jgi:tetrathionate reductase subunit B
MNITTPPPAAGVDRRDFLKNVAAGSIATTVLLVYRPFDTSAAEDKEEADILEIVKKASGQKKDPNYAYVININLCIGAGKCVEACSTENDVPAGLFRTWVERYVRTGDGIYVDSPNGSVNGFIEAKDDLVENSREAWFAPKLCNHCRNAPCIQVCPVGATFQTSDGFVLVDDKHCIGCAACVQGCPYGSRFMNPETHVADKCTWCYHRVKNDQQPACVEACPTKARMFGDLNDPESEVTKLFKANNWMVLKPEMHTDSYCFYVGMPKETI